LIEKLKASAPLKPKVKVEFAHQNLVVTLEGRLEVIDKELTVRILAQSHGSPLVAMILLSHCLFGLLFFLASTTGAQKG
jgi:hypothetical protein